ncbi:MAG: 23S rRNA (cytidine(2498)-2'-O)-methyltransferase RlmM [Deltaproteobacteria bacterium]|nr:23S rRNA (cytidine(2498)-2'-O)-methyltransferase RlmM [Deltaproteobacteria bacterium]
MSCLVLYCRGGFEKECAADIQSKASSLGVDGFCKAKPGSAYVVFQPNDAQAADRLVTEISFRELIFARQIFVSPGLVDKMSADDRIGPLLEALESTCPAKFFEVFLETADNDKAKELLAFCKKFSRPFNRALRQSGRLTEDTEATKTRLHVLFLSATAAYPGVSQADNSSPWFMGIPRLKLSREAPSRSALKLEEALHVFLTAEERNERLRSGMKAVDLGASPGGWSWQLARRNLLVTAVDNGPMDRKLMSSGLVEHIRNDGFSFRPEHPVDWLVCDMVEKPGRIAKLVAGWTADGVCSEAIFNLKLPMKKRFTECQRCVEIISRQLSRAGIRFRLALKQLYHDREEVTAHLRRLV